MNIIFVAKLVMLRSEFWKKIGIFVGGFLTFSGVILMIVLLSLTVNKEVKQDEYAVGYNTFEMEFTEVRSQGKYVTEVGEEFIILKRTLQEFSTDLECLSKDKVLLDLSFALQYQYSEGDLIPIILRQFGENGVYKKFIKNHILSSVSETCLKYNAEDYYTIRSTIDIDMFDSLVVKINDQDIGTTIEFFQLVNIGFPPEFSAKITEKQHVQQTGDTAINDRASILTDANTELLEAEREATISVINANNTASININKANANANSQKALWDQRAFAYENAAMTLGFNGTDMISYIKSINVQEADTLLTSS